MGALASEVKGWENAEKIVVMRRAHELLGGGEDEV
jgi:hypothetical protein